MKYRWCLATAQPAVANSLAKALNISPLLAQCLLNRGLNEPGSIERFLEPRLKQLADPFLLPVDCGSTSVECIAWLQEQGVDVVVLDHHQISSPVPKAVALVNPQAQSRTTGKSSPPLFQELCSVGLAFKLAHALVKRGRE